MRIEIAPEESYHLINHGPCNLLTTGDGARRNVAPINWTMPLNNDPPLMLTVVEEGIFTDTLLRANGEFVINVVGEPLAAKVLVCGRSHGSETDKFETVGLTPAASKKVKPPYLKESLAHIECQPVNRHPYDGVTIYVGRVVHAEVEEAFWTGKTLDAEKAKTIHHLSGGTFAVSDRVIRVR
ncbi:MAG: hypothetical protein A3G34_17190 [Candidatus Lindowbacteria bacterium RIFCSPLOWO2_12_FULL_62_27]|nr:MAG: hypothetical protein A3G34_17190 [Candidatus Lindowbacteria bacterium RIFCSPLOWO2_12_FULL_62_27]OGH63986.1 MAG: hypothetical protein A3I06_10545 [Candidatus Lindowbacteria bacterium RIFCSPLOWO2_02_FULL_62_12]